MEATLHPLMKSLLPILAALCLAPASPQAAEFQSHPPMRPLPEPSRRPLPAGSVLFVDAKNGDDAHPGTREKPWRTLAASLKNLAPGDTLCLRGGVYWEGVTVTVSGTREKPITIRSHPGELAIIDGGIREFFESPATAWEPVEGGAPGEFRSVNTFKEAGSSGNFGDSMVPLHRYITLADLRSPNEFWKPELGDRADDPGGIYCGPGTRRDEKTGRIHVRLAHTRLPGLGALAYRGETDPRRIPLVVAGREYTVQINRSHLRLEDIVVRGAKRAAIVMENAEDITLDGVTLYGGQMALRTARVNGLRAVDCAFRGHAAPWHSRAHHKYRAGSGYLILADGDAFDFERCEFTDNHDFIAMPGLVNCRIRGSFVDNFNDDGFEPGPKRARGRIEISQNLVTRVLSPFTAHGKKPVPVDAEPGSGLHIFRNVFDLRRGTYKTPPAGDDPGGAFLDERTEILAHDHGSPVHPIYHVYQNTFLMRSGGWRGYYAFTWGGHMRGTTRRVFNNLFVQEEGAIGVNFTALAEGDDLQSDGNLHWSVRSPAPSAAEVFAKFRASPLFAASRAKYPPGWGASDVVADPKFAALGTDGKSPVDLRLAADSPARAAGIAVPAEWPDPLRGGAGKADIGALPFGAAAPGFGIHHRITLSGAPAGK